ncbi:MAG: hypothetical protein KatS3mg097_257 [Candidatus Parcubacteria bacterium]|nr:MAG: hypothetical protein KatS3mg097_257 [Candidatus Parcubacteria bacterium]
MKIKLIFLFFLIGLIPVVFQIQNVKALSCLRLSFPILGIVSDISVKGSETEIVLDKFYTFNTSDIDNEKIISIDRYENIVKEYIENNFQLPEKPSLQDNDPTSKDIINKVFIPTNAFKQIQIDKNDIIINGPPFYVCTYRFTGIFTKDGKLKSAIINDNYQDYSYRNNKLEVEAGKELECYEHNICKIEVNFKLDDKSFNLSPPQLYKPTGSSIKSISLLDSSSIKKGNDGRPVVFDWGLNTYVTYVLNFSDFTNHSISSSTPTPNIKPEPPSPTEQKSLTPTLSEKTTKNFFQKIWLWLILLLFKQFAIY